MSLLIWFAEDFSFNSSLLLIYLSTPSPYLISFRNKHLKLNTTHKNHKYFTNLDTINNAQYLFIKADVHICPASRRSFNIYVASPLINLLPPCIILFQHHYPFATVYWLDKIWPHLYSLSYILLFLTCTRILFIRGC